MKRGPSDHVHELPSHQHSSIPPFDQENVAAASFTEQQIKDMISAAVKSAVAWLAGENQELREQVAELEIEIEIERNKFTDVGDGDIFPKHRGLFQDEN